eukprot:TRINITY_DN2467_c1_g1_i1.p1 TRINITY_DN2467_c1_g1~~TRINITY_DN2467_c1_g1_i1.p1  ORF type:complete len:556 (+),score=206.23 TRINITY_DN2467_c1_g1_i1:50-1669(+)
MRDDTRRTVLACGVVIATVLAAWWRHRANQRKSRRNALRLRCEAKGVKVLIVGSGLCGLAAALKLQELGIPFEIAEKDEAPGGTWRNNTYPGCAVDVASFLYSLSAYPTPKAGWSRSYCQQPELLAYTNEIIDVFNLRQHIRLNTLVSATRWCESEGCWEVTMQPTSGGADVSRRYKAVISASGPLHHSVCPVDSAGFKGVQMHTAKWDSSADLKGKTIAVVGTGASAIQAIPRLAAIASKMYVVQRTPSWVLGKDSGPMSSLVRWLAALPIVSTLLRALFFLRGEALFHLGFSAKKTFLSSLLEREYHQGIKKHLPKQYDDMIPPHPLGCKRILLASDYLPALGRENVEVLTKASAKGVSQDSLIVAQGGVERALKVDCIVWATGFNPRKLPYTMSVGNLEIQNENDLEALSGAYVGLMAPGIPNHFTLLGARTGLGHNSVLLMAESQLEVAAQLLEKAIDDDACVSVREDVAKEYNDSLDARLESSVWAQCGSWYRNTNGTIDVLFPGSVMEFMSLTKKRLDMSKFVFLPKAKTSRL